MVSSEETKASRHAVHHARLYPEGQLYEATEPRFLLGRFFLIHAILLSDYGLLAEAEKYYQEAESMERRETKYDNQLRVFAARALQWAWQRHHV